MSTDDGGSTGAARPYNRPRRYPVPAPAAVEPPGPQAPADVTRQNPTLAEAAQDYGRRHGDPGVPDAPQPYDYPGAPPPGPHPHPHPHPHPAAPGASRTLPTRVLVLGAAVLVVIAVIGLVVGLSGGDDSTPKAQPDARATPSTAVATAAPSQAPSSSVGAPVGAGSSSAGSSSAESPSELCTRLGASAPFTSYVARLQPTAQLPPGYVDPQGGTRVGICVGTFRPGAGAGRGTLAYLAEYERLPATQYAAALRAAGWVPVPTLPTITYGKLTTTVTLVQQGTTLVTVVGSGH